MWLRMMVTALFRSSFDNPIYPESIAIQVHESNMFNTNRTKLEGKNNTIIDGTMQDSTHTVNISLTSFVIKSFIG